MKKNKWQTIALSLLCFYSLSNLTAQSDSTKFKVIAFYSATWDGGHISYAHEANAWFPEMAKKYNFVYDSTNNWSNLNASYLAQYQVVLFLDNQPPVSQRAEFEKYMKNGGSWMGFHVVAFNQDPTEWDWYYNKFLGMGSYKNNTWAPTSAVLKVEDKTHPATINLPDTFSTAPNEWYAWMIDLRTKANIDILCSIDPASFPLGTGTGSGGASEIWKSGYYPVVWSNSDYHMLYINMGHNLVDYGKNNKTLSWTFKNETQNKLVLDGLFWLAGLNKPDPRATKLSIASPANGTSFKEPASIEINVNATDSDGVAKVEFYNEATKLGEALTAPYHFIWENVLVGNYDITVKAIDSLNNVVSAWVSVNVQGEGPYNGKMATIPGKIELENFNYGGQGVGYSDSEIRNQGSAYRAGEGVDIEVCSDAGAGYNTGFTVAGEWLKYTVNVTKAGDYYLQVRVASTSTGKSLHVELDGMNISGVINVPNTTGWQKWQTVNVPVTNLSLGQKELKVVMDTEGYNLNYLNFTQEPVLVKSLNENKANQIYPNPSNGKVYIKLAKQKAPDTRLSIFDHLGRELKSVMCSNAKVENEICIDFSGYNKGIYFLKFSDNNDFAKVAIQ